MCGYQTQRARYQCILIDMRAFFILCVLFSVSVAHAVALPFTRDLFEGMPANEEVHRLSIVLKKEGFYVGELTKVYSPTITRAVSSFQAKRGIVPINGIVGTRTRYELNKIVLGWLGKSMTDAEPKKATTTTTPAKKTVTPVKATEKATTTTVKKVVAPKPQPCVHRGKTFKHGEKVRLYKYTVARQGGVCPSMIRRCNDGVLEGDLSYRQHTCTIPTSATVGEEEKKQTTQKTPTLDDTTTQKETTTTKTTTTKTTTTKTNEEKLTNGCKAGGVQFNVGATTEGCIGPGRSDPTASQCLAALMPVYKCQMSGNWICVEKCQHNYY